MQDRIGPNRAGPKGLLQPIADGIKNLLKEEVIPDGANKVFFVIAPAISLMAALMIPLTIPWAAPIPLEFDVTLPLLGRFVHHGTTAAAVTALPIGFLYVLAISSVGVYGIALGGWASNNKYSLMGGLRATAQMVSYEVAMGLSLIPVLLLVGNVSFVRDRVGAATRAAGLARPAAVLSRRSSSWCPGSRRPTGCRSTCPSPSPNSWRGITPSTAP